MLNFTKQILQEEEFVSMSLVKTPSLHANVYLLPPQPAQGGTDSLDSISGPPGKVAGYK